MIQMVSSHIFLFFKTCPCATHLYILLALRQNLLNIIFQAVSKVSEIAETVFIRHVRPAQGPDMSGSHVSSLYKGVDRPSPLEPCVFFSLPLHLLQRPRAL
jgi:hypothetical protein